MSKTDIFVFTDTTQLPNMIFLSSSILVEEHWKCFPKGSWNRPAQVNV